ncbi:response regulator transcription factor [Lachnoclostridium sp. Marseille-P6806]|uniref:response regulator transcription factor n=1 Tax=Lachnoclostridium sp. Marseille-P6806 TaxID=2364793 RepID=UPI00102FD4F9|nr:response regulator [Lachnoclostridium sp. Marseille-P6806]
MAKVLIVEDELLVGVGIRNLISWEKLGCEVAGMARDGKAGLVLYRQSRPDIILTDIKMPEMNGLEMIAAIRQEDPETRIIILTAYDEFDLLHEAMRFGITDYLLKWKLSAKELERVAEKAIRELCQLRPGCWQESVGMEVIPRKKELLESFVLTDAMTEETFARAAAEQALRLRPENLYFCLMEFRRGGQPPDSARRQKLWNEIPELLEELLQTYRRGETFLSSDALYWLLVSFEDVGQEQEREAKLTEMLRHVSYLIRSYGNSGVRFGISGCRSGYSSLKTQYAEALEALRAPEAADGELHWYSSEETETARPEVKDCSRKVREICRYMEEHYREDISLHTLAQQVALSPNYTSNLFKKETGVNYSEYLNIVRIERAKELMRTTHLNVAEISDRVGFSEVSYFSRTFMKYAGIRPKKYMQAESGEKGGQL